MALDFPTPTTIGQTFTQGSLTYVWDGTKWVGQGGAAVIPSKIEKGNTSAEITDTGSDGQFKVTTEGTQRLTVGSSGNLGIGTSSSATLLDVNQTTQFDITNATASAGIFVRGGGTRGQNNYGGAITLGKIDATRPGGSIAAVQTSSDPDQVGLAFFTHGQTASNDNVAERLRITSDGNLGIGTSSPKTKLDINGTIISTPVSYSSNQNQPYLIAGTTGWTGAATNWNTFGMQHRIKTNSAGVPRLTIDNYDGEVFCVTNDKKVGIGTSSPSARLEARQNGTGNLIQVWSSDLGTNDRNINLRSPSSDSISEPFVFQTGNSVAFQIDATEAMRIDDSGRVGIGTSSPSSPLTVEQSSGNVNFELHSTSSGRGTQIKTHNDHATFFHGLAGDTTGEYIYYTADAKDHVFSTNNSERLRINSAGLVGIGTSSPSQAVDVVGPSTSNFPVSWLRSTGTRGYLYSDGGGVGITSSTNLNQAGIYLKTNDRIDFRVNNSERMRIDSSGNVKIGSGSTWATSSGGLQLAMNSNDAYITTYYDSHSTTLGAGTSYKNKIRVSGTSADNNITFHVGTSGSNEAMRLNGSGKLLLGTSTGGSVARLQVQGSTIFNDAFLDLAYNGSGNIAANTILGLLRFTDQASNANVFAQISCVTDGTAGSSDYPGRLVFSTTADGASSPTERMRIDSSGDATFTGTISDSLGPVRRVKVDPASTGFTLTAAYAGQLIRQSGSGQNITIPANVFSAGDMVSFFNVGSGVLNILSSAVTVYNSADGDTGNTRTIAAKGMATIICTASNEFVISGTQLT